MIRMAFIALQAVVWISSIAIQIPIQVQLSAKGLSITLIERLIQTRQSLPPPVIYC
jgi:hypothetical protein